MDIDQVLSRASSLVAPPEVWLRLNELVANPLSTAAQIGEVVARDPSLTANLLKVVNSPYYSLPSKVDTIDRAITIVGTDELFRLATAITATRVFHRIPGMLVDPHTFWRHNICVAILARRTAKRCNVLNPERLYVAGILHDVGSLLLYNQLPEMASDCIMAANGDEAVLALVEREKLGFDHAELGAALLAQWHIPEPLTEAIRFHHAPQEAQLNPLNAAILHIADTAANRSEAGRFTGSEAASIAGVDPAVWSLTQLAPDFLDEVVVDVEEELYRSIALFLP